MDQFHPLLSVSCSDFWVCSVYGVMNFSASTSSRVWRILTFSDIQLHRLQSCDLLLGIGVARIYHWWGHDVLTANADACTLKPGFHYPSWRPELTGDRFPFPVNTGRVDGRAFPLAELTGAVTRVVETGLLFYSYFPILSLLKIFQLSDWGYYAHVAGCIDMRILLLLLSSSSSSSSSLYSRTPVSCQVDPMGVCIGRSSLHAERRFTKSGNCPWSVHTLYSTTGTAWWTLLSAGAHDHW